MGNDISSRSEPVPDNPNRSSPEPRGHHLSRVADAGGDSLAHVAAADGVVPCRSLPAGARAA
jgi:hypothetical protein